MKKNVWIFNHYACTPKTGSIIRHYNFGKFLMDKNYNVTLFASNQLHYLKTTFDIGDDLYRVYEDEKVPVVFINTPKYFDNGKARIINMLSYFRKIFKVTKLFCADGGSKPDVIIASSVHPLTCVAGIYIAKRYKVPCIVEIRDLWPEAIVEYSDRFTSNSLIIKLLYQGEKWIYKKADKVIFTIPGGKDYIIERGWQKTVDLDKIEYINNGVDLDVFDYNKDNFIFNDHDLNNNDFFNVVYTGAIRKVNNVGVLVDVAKKLVDKRIKLLVWGTGDELESLQKRVEEENIENIIFKGNVDKNYIPSILSQSDVNLSTYSCAKINRFGTSRNKNFEYMAAGKPMISTEQDTYLYDDSFAISFNYKTAEDIVQAIDKIYNLSIEERSKMGLKARIKAKEFDSKVLSDKLIDIIEGVSKDDK